MNEDLETAPSGADDPALSHVTEAQVQTPPPAEEAAPEAAAPEQKDEDPKPSRFQARFSELVTRRKEAEARASHLERQLSQLQQQLQQVPQDYDNWDYEQQSAFNVNRAVKTDRYEQTLADLESEQMHAVEARNAVIIEKVNSAIDRMPDFHQVFANVPATDAMLDEIAESDHGAEIAYWLGKNPQEAFRIASLPLHRQGAAIARIEQRVTPPNGARKLTQTPPPIKPVGAGTPGVAMKDPSQMSEAEYYRWRTEQEKSRSG